MIFSFCVDLLEQSLGYYPGAVAVDKELYVAVGNQLVVVGSHVVVGNQAAAVDNLVVAEDNLKFGGTFCQSHQ